ncbi:adenylate/guanylate cyclase domain-containing protein [Flavobacterium zepuense]|uniref:Adenylate/guanylate cyclase domain-containing protein n=1 Tax=Flavobacterium zepuense TaxID=2593302 RepID=A0A552UVT2_9FLAO|nr:adenylate/guanylate cyclase domain-containing protein [Flavobacterium zepuense]TRW22298.1 adenylate/guanylate cyclase domain-containing protein [Flavobacterium zepuense]
MKKAAIISALKAQLGCPQQRVKKQLVAVATKRKNNTTGYQALASCKVDFSKKQSVIKVSPQQEQLAQRFSLPANVKLNADTAQPNSNGLTELLGSITNPTEERNLALLFLDIRNFTAIMELHPAQTVLQIVRLLFLMFSKSIKENGGRIIETGGDSVYAVFGLDNPFNAVGNSVTASHSILADLDTFNTLYATPQFGLDLEIGIGLHKGRVAVSYSDLDYGHLTVMGLPVNIAARLQSATKELNNTIVISDEAYRTLEPNDTTAATLIRLKGISDPVAVRLLGHPYHNGVSATA